jgi:hypothetical protein
MTEEEESGGITKIHILLGVKIFNTSTFLIKKSKFFAHISRYVFPIFKSSTFFKQYYSTIYYIYTADGGGIELDVVVDVDNK